MATIGQVLLTPEIGWSRYDNTNTRIGYVGTWAVWTDSYRSGANTNYTTTIGGYVTFKFKGTALRIISEYGPTMPNEATTIVNIDGIDYSGINQYSSTIISPAIIFETLSLSDAVHTVTIKSTSTSGFKLSLDAIDINTTGYILIIPGSSLPSPETGWKRVSYTDPYFIYTNPWIDGGSGLGKYTSDIGEILKFKFYGTKIRFIAYTNSAYGSTATVSVDGVPYPFPVNFNVGAGTLICDIGGLAEGYHNIKINSTEAKVTYFTAIDIDSSGYLIPPIGNITTTPEIGWTRYEQIDKRLTYTGIWTSESSASYSGGTGVYQMDATSKVEFKFKGSGIKVLCKAGYTDKAYITIDGVTTEFTTAYVNGNSGATLCYENLALQDIVHTVILGNNNGAMYFALDAIDLKGSLIHTVLTEKFDIQDMEIGDVISCDYVAANGMAGTFSNLGKAKAPLLPSTPSATPNGSFYFIKVDKGLLVADRSIQYNIAWSTLNQKDLIEGTTFKSSTVPALTIADTKGFIVNQSRYADGMSGVLAFDKEFTSPYACWYIDNNLENWVSIKYPTATKNNVYTLTCMASGELNPLGMARDWKLQASNDGVTWIDLDTRINQSGWSSLEQRFYRFNNEIAYSYYRLYVSAWNRTGSYGGIRELDLAEELPLSIRALRGGQAWKDTSGNLISTDQNEGAYSENEWDKYILNSNLNGKITPGDVNIWNIVSSFGTITIESPIANITYTNGVNSNGMGYRLKRGKIASANAKEMSYWASTADTTTGFRPVLEFIDTKIETTKRPKTLWY